MQNGSQSRRPLGHMGLPRCRSTTGCTSSASNREDFILLLARRERIVNPMAGCEKVLYAIRPAMAAEGASMGVNRFYKLMKANGMMVPKRRKYSCTTTAGEERTEDTKETGK